MIKLSLESHAEPKSKIGIRLGCRENNHQLALCSSLCITTIFADATKQALVLWPSSHGMSEMAGYSS